MKKFIKFTSLLVLSSAVVYLSGCASSSPSTQAAENAGLTLAAATATELAVQSNPSYSLYFVGAAQALQTVGSGTNDISVSTVELALSSEGVTNPVVALALEQAITLGDSYIQSSVGTNSSSSIIELKSVCSDISTGITEGLSLAGKSTLKKK